MNRAYDVVVVGSGVNGMVCALLAALDGLSVKLIEAHESLGGGVRTKELTLPGFLHDVCSAVHPFGLSSPILRSLELENEGLRWIQPDCPLAHPLEGEPAVLLDRDVERTADNLGSAGPVYRKMMGWLLRDWGVLEDQLLGPALAIPPLSKLPSLARFGPLTLLPASWLGKTLGSRGGALWAGLAGHSLLPMETLSSSAIACVLGLMAHRVGWPLPEGGAFQIAVALEKKLRRAGVEIECSRRVLSVQDLPSARAAVFDLSAKQLLAVLGPRLSSRTRGALERYRLGPGIFKLDYALSEPVPWSDPRVAQAGTVHIGGSLQEIARSERAVWDGQMAESPFLLGVQPSLFDPSRAPEGKHTFWVYAHTPNGWNGDATNVVERQIEKYAPGFTELVLGRSCFQNSDFEAYNPNYVGGDILGGANTLSQVVGRPIWSPDPYHLNGSFYCCSASVPPGGGVHGMGGFHAYQSLKKRHFQ